MTDRSVYIEDTESADYDHLLDALVQRLGGLDSRILPGDRVLIKPNFVAPFKKATTDLEFIRYFASKIKALGGIPILAESSGYEFDTEATFQILGIDRFCQEEEIELLNIDKEKFSDVSLGRGLGTVQIARIALDIKLIINLPVLKGHSITRVTGAVKNFFGLLSKPSRRKMHTKHLNKAIAALARLMNNSLHFVDARHLLTRAVFGQSNPLGYILAGHDPFTLDHFGSRLLGINPSLVKYLEDAEAYEVIGALPTSIPQEMKKESFKKQFHRQMYALFYWLDEMKCSMFGGRSIIPFLHWHLGIHPEINTRDSSELQRLSTLCDVGAIDTEKGEIQKDKCIKVRCLKCYREAKPGDIVLKGFGRPKNNK